MHRIAAICALLVGACSFKADYAGGQYTCTDGVCPAGLVCDSQQVCVVPHQDAGKPDGMPDARQTAMTCSDPQPFPAAGGTTMGTTVGKLAQVSSMCGGTVFNGPEAVYAITTVSGAHLTITIAGRKVYALTMCQTLPQTPTCEGNMFGKPGNPLSLFPTPGTQYIVVDEDVAGTSGAYTLTISL